MTWDDDTPDATLLHAWQQDDKAAADRLISRYAPALYNFFASKVTTGADDLCRRTLEDCRADQGPWSPPGEPDSVRSRLFAAARRRLLEHLIAQGGRTPGGSALDPAEHSVAHVLPGASEVVAAGEQHRQLLMVLRQLPLDDQVVLELSQWEGLTTAELSAVIGASESVIAQRVRDARRKLQAQIDQGRQLTDQTFDAQMTEHER